jgi:hypothetical protein
MMRNFQKTAVSQTWISEILLLLKFWIPVAFFILGVQAAQARVSLLDYPEIGQEFAEALLSTQTMSRTRFKDSIGIRVVGLKVNFNDNVINPNIETVVFRDGQYHELDRSTPLPHSLVEASENRSYCVLRVRKTAASDGDIVELNEEQVYLLNPYIPSAVRTQRINPGITLTLNLMKQQSIASANLMAPVADELRCHLSHPEKESAGGLVELLDQVMGPWVQFEILGSELL